jgi:cytochrome c-type biogenesis protein CcmH/NrfG
MTYALESVFLPAILSLWARSNTLSSRGVFTGTEQRVRCFRPEVRTGRLGSIQPSQRIFQSRTATEDRGMKHLLNGVVIAAAVAITGPVWAQTGAPMTPMAPAAPPAASSMSPEEPTATTRHHRARHHRVVRHGASADAG